MSCSDISLIYAFLGLFVEINCTHGNRAAVKLPPNHSISNVIPLGVLFMSSVMLVQRYTSGSEFKG